MIIHCENNNCKYYLEDSCMKNMNKEMISIDNTGRCVDFEILYDIKINYEI
ncbi:hypothetical protein [Clostridium tetani]|uniref:hypothetical protein n=1 Tax=Clostridium tetani TaxID=1513 RepID=UPI000B0846A0|nr:hypothetical protein [Clostridium tetani]